MPDISSYNKDAFLFGRKDFGQFWDANETSRRNDYSDYFFEVKKKFGLGKDYGLYSFRHTFISKLYGNYFHLQCALYQWKLYEQRIYSLV
jgi:hypothetical protein